MEHDWDNLILLDACRWDVFHEYSQLDGKLMKVVSRGNYSWEFMEENFIGRELNDTVYVTANPYSENLDQEQFYKIESLLNEWNEEKETVLPNDVVNAALNAREKYPNKRLIIHFMQPHLPHISDIAEEIEYDQVGWYHGDDDLLDRSEKKTIFSAYKNNEISQKELFESYRQNFTFVEGYVSSLVNDLKGKTVITSDHGENLGENYFGCEIFGHRNETKECRFVPWLELPYDERIRVEKEDPIEDTTVGDSIVNQRLEDLGYI
ncbi:Arylsulfatase A or related enzyme [Halanaeroarchaeum sp. HSR-CO]|uniref:LTA synthase family protein n=1 Tax=Halanaeroarchaeum sp. HSR-CO TaxID=2866382 RepID=UPI00217F148C|nr:LTA synthase family protein [Halanaeroarchaeum sp. HSR-CO]UWG48099.1 Arylsulfatase A or related enzyme [Halanaeroarchaeum sp. HSR-CO]